MHVPPRENNPYWPLPADYPSLTREGQRLARVNAASLNETPALQVASWDFFRRYYLFPTERGEFYDHGVEDSPECHYNWVYLWANEQFSALAAPRGLGKSTLLRERALQDLVTRRHYKIVGFYSIMTKVRTNFTKIMVQIEHNPRILEDFGALKPHRGGHGSWNKNWLLLRNGCQLMGIPVGGANLGERPNRVYFDDPENPEDHKDSKAEWLQDFRDMILSHIVPMGTKYRMPLAYVNTNYTRRTFSWWLHTTDEPRIVDHWGRLLERARWIDEDTGEYKYLAPTILTPEFLEEQYQKMGPSLFAANYLNEPTSDSEKILSVHPHLNTYTVLNPRDNTYVSPLNADSRVQTHQLTHIPQGGDIDDRTETRQIRRPFGETVAAMTRFITVDYAHTTTSMSDFSAIHVLGFENSQVHQDTLWSLDAWVGRVRPAQLIEKIRELATRWHVRTIGIEAYPIQMTWFEEFKSQLYTGWRRAGLPAAPAVVVPIKFPPHMQKEDRIKAMEWRFVQYRLKLPSREEIAQRSQESRAAYLQLYEQIQNFTEDGSLNQYDDILDTLSMHQGLTVPRRRVPTRPDVMRGHEAFEAMKSGQTQLVDGIPVTHGMDTQNLTPDVVRAFRQHTNGYFDEENNYVEPL